MNKPYLPIPAGHLSPRAAKITVTACLLAGVMLGLAPCALGSPGLSVSTHVGAPCGHALRLFGLFGQRGSCSWRTFRLFGLFVRRSSRSGCSARSECRLDGEIMKPRARKHVPRAPTFMAKTIVALPRSSPYRGLGNGECTGANGSAPVLPMLPPRHTSIPSRRHNAPHRDTYSW